MRSACGLEKFREVIVAGSVYSLSVEETDVDSGVVDIAEFGEVLVGFGAKGAAVEKLG